MLHLSYSQLYSFVDGIDEFIGEHLSRKKYTALLGDISHYRRLHKEYKVYPLVAIIAIVVLKYQERGLVIDITPQVTIRINRGTNLESILAMIKSSVCWENRRKYGNIDRKSRRIC